MILHDRNAVVRSLDEVDAVLQRPVETFMIGGGALSIRGLKDATKDIDHVVATEEAYGALSKALVDAGYAHVRAHQLTGPYRALAARGIFVQEGHPQWDVFVAVVARKLRLSPGMVARARPADRERPNLQVRLLANEDIIVFKSVAGRVGDMEDTERILLTRPDWGSILDEMRWQCRHSDTAWSGVFHGAMEELAVRHSIPILDGLADLADQDVLDKAVLNAIRNGADSRSALDARFPHDVDFLGDSLERLAADAWIVEDGARYRSGSGPALGAP